MLFKMLLIDSLALFSVIILYLNDRIQKIMSDSLSRMPDGTLLVAADQRK